MLKWSKQVGFIKPVWESADYSKWSMFDSSSNITIDYGTVMNLDNHNVSYPILITIAGDSQVNQNVSVTCILTLDGNTETMTFDITPVGANVSYYHL